MLIISLNTKTKASLSSRAIPIYIMSDKWNIGAKVPHPMNPNRVGELPESIKAVNAVIEQIKGHIAYLSELAGKEPNDLVGPAEVQDEESIWFGFSKSHIMDRKDFFAHLLLPEIENISGCLSWCSKGT